VPRAGLGARFLGRDLATFARELCDIAVAGLARLPGGADDRSLIEPLADFARAGRTPADDMLRDFDACEGDPQRLIEAWQLPETA
jgi:gamma-glutamylcysteine synthetase